MAKERKRLNVGVIMGNLDAPHAFELAGGLSAVAKEQDVNLLFFPGMYAKSYYKLSMLPQHIEYDYQNTVIFDYIHEQDVDVLIISMGTVKAFLEHETETEFLNKFHGIPCIILEDKVPGYPCITINNKSGLEQGIRHLITHHHCKKIAFVSGNKGNFDANERLEVYLRLMEEYGLSYTDRMIGYGEFTEYTDDIVSAMLDETPDLDAICFANDMMAIGGYRECKRRGLKVGKDIAIMGFDDYVLAMSMNPPLTTVRVSAAQIGMIAMKEAIAVADGEEVADVEIPSELILRRSCGCSDHEAHRDMQVEEKALADMAEDYTQQIAVQIAVRGANKLVYQDIWNYVYRFVEGVLELVAGKRDAEDESVLLQPIQTVLSEEYQEYVAIDKMYIALDQFVKAVLRSTKDMEVRLKIVNALAVMYGYIAKQVVTGYHKINARHKQDSWYATFITRDTMLYSADEREAMYQMALKLRALQFHSAYIYLFKAPITNYNDGMWKKPEAMFLAAYTNGGESRAYEVAERPIMSVGEGLERLRRGDSRYTTVCFNLFSNEEQYGVFVCESDIQEFSFAYTISLQIGSALKFLELMKKQMKMHKQLEVSLDTISRKNDLLSQLSVSDELTGLLNRRGLFERVGDMLNENQGALAAMIFIDMDNLKGVNDTFGHTEGDYALQQIAEILKKSFRKQDLVGRIGGDEFAAFLIVDEAELLHGTRLMIERLTSELNSSCGKPYYIEMSIGIKEFICSPSMNLNLIMRQADEILYEDKKNKRISCIKNE